MIPIIYFPPSIEATPYVQPAVLSRFTDQRSTSALVDPYFPRDPMVAGLVPLAWEWADKNPPLPRAVLARRLKISRLIQPKIEATPGEFVFDDEDA